MTRPLVVVGAGGFGRETLDVVDAINAVSSARAFEVVGVLDDAPSQENCTLLERRRVAYLGTVGEWLAGERRADYLIGVGTPATRRRIAERCDAAGLTAAVVVHPSATYGVDVTFGPGTVVCAGVRITNNVHLGRHVHLNLNVTVGHDTCIGDFVSVNPLVAISGDCRIGAGTMFGTGSVILQGLETGDGSVVGASACVTRDVDAGAVVKGVPAR